MNYSNKSFSLKDNINEVKFVTTLNTELLLKSIEDEKLFKILNSKNSIITVDGQWILFALKRKYRNLDIVKNSGSDLIYSITKEASIAKKKVLLLGALPDSNCLAVAKLKELYSYDDIYGFSPSFSSYPFSEDFIQSIKETITNVKPHIIITAFGVPKQEYWAYDNKEYLEKTGVEHVLFFGGAIDMVAGKFKRVPKIFQVVGLEGLYRLFLEPKRIKRYYKLVKIVPLIIFNKL